MSGVSVGKCKNAKNVKKEQVQKNELWNETRLLKGNKVKLKSATMQKVKKKTCNLSTFKELS